MRKLLPIIALSLFPMMAHSQEQKACGPRDDPLGFARERFNIDIIFAGSVEEGGLLVEIGTSPEKRRWVVFITDKKGITCVALEGVKFNVIIVPNT